MVDWNPHDLAFFYFPVSFLTIPSLHSVFQKQNYLQSFSDHTILLFSLTYILIYFPLCLDVSNPPFTGLTLPFCSWSSSLEIIFSRNLPSEGWVSAPANYLPCTIWYPLGPPGAPPPLLHSHKVFRVTLINLRVKWWAQSQPCPVLWFCGDWFTWCFLHLLQHLLSLSAVYFRWRPPRKLDWHHHCSHHQS